MRRLAILKGQRHSLLKRLRVNSEHDGATPTTVTGADSQDTQTLQRGVLFFSNLFFLSARVAEAFLEKKKKNMTNKYCKHEWKCQTIAIKKKTLQKEMSKKKKDKMCPQFQKQKKTKKTQ